MRSSTKPVFPPSGETWAIPGTGSLLDVEIRISIDDPGEAVGIDDFRVSGRRQVEWTAAGAGDFYQASHWSLDVVPAALDNALIQNGGTAVVDGSAVGIPTVLELFDLRVGSHAGSGGLEADGMDLQIAVDFDIGSFGSEESPDAGSLQTGGTAVIRNAELVDVGDDVTIAGVVSREASEVANNVASDLSNLAPQADLSITNDDGTPVYVPGDMLVYTITAHNHGPSHAPDSRILDLFPDLLTSCLWECTAGGGSFCTPGPELGDIDQLVDLPVGGEVTFIAACEVQAEASDEPLINVASIATDASVLELEPTDNTAVDIDESSAVTIFFDGFESGDLSSWSATQPEP